MLCIVLIIHNTYYGARDLRISKKLHNIILKNIENMPMMQD